MTYKMYKMESPPALVINQSYVYLCHPWYLMQPTEGTKRVDKELAAWMRTAVLAVSALPIDARDAPKGI